MAKTSTLLLWCGLAILLWVLLLDTWRPATFPIGPGAGVALALLAAGMLLALIGVSRGGPSQAAPAWYRVGVTVGVGAIGLALAGFGILAARHRTPTPVQFLRLREQRPFGTGELSRDADGAVLYTTRHGLEISVERSQFDLDVLPSEAQLHAAHELVLGVRAQAPRLADYDSVQSVLGFTINATVLGDDAGAELEHLINPDHIGDGVVLDPERPEALVFRRRDPDKPELVGYMFMMPRGERGPQVGGPLTRWHHHPETFFCMDSLGVPRAPRPEMRGCPAGLNSGPSGEMLHVWLVNNAYGIFSHMMGATTLAAGDHAGAHH
ncbi:MAG: hypothetical protein KJZ47_12595 [Gemmatimonadales bacterium]|nr:hypothetical protein [Gemmatimonadales bacterium]